MGNKTPPESLKFNIDDETFKKSNDYSRAKARFSVFSNTYALIQNVLIVQYDVLHILWNKAGVYLFKVSPYLPKFMASGQIPQSLVFLLLLQFISMIFSTPLSYYQHFVLEEKYGFNKLTIKLFFTDMVKMFLLSIVFGGPLISAFLKIVDYFGDNFAIYAWLLICAFQVLIQTIYPTIIQPLFNKVEPLEKGELRTSIENLAAKNKFPLTKLFVIDGSTRSGHSNAYFMGLPWSKQIVLYDTLVESSSVNETTAVLAHEIGHWALSHTTKMLVVSNAYILSIFGLFSLFINNNALFQSFGFMDSKPILIGFLLFNDILQPFDCVFTFFTNIISRKHEYEADNYALKQGYKKELANALIKLQIENLSAMEADWLYSAYHYSHPILSERLSAIEYTPQEKVAVPKKTVKSD